MKLRTTSLNIVFAGTPAFTLPSLEALANSEHCLQAIYTQPDRPAGRGRKLQASAVKEWAQQHQYPIYQPNNFKEASTVSELAALKPDVMVVIAYGLILPQCVLDIPRLGCINVHASLLPRWRGAAPIQYAILHGEQQTGVTLMQMDAGMDTGALLSHVTCPISVEDTSQTLHDKLSHLAAPALIDILDMFAAGQSQSTPQENHLATYAAKINKIDAAISWQQPAHIIDQQIRAFNPWPIAYTHMGDEQILRIHQARVGNAPSTTHEPGTILAMDKQGMLVNTGDGTLLIQRIQFPGAKVISVADWLHTGRQQLHVNLVLQ